MRTQGPSTQLELQLRMSKYSELSAGDGRTFDRRCGYAGRDVDCNREPLVEGNLGRDTGQRRACHLHERRVQGLHTEFTEMQ